MDYFCFSDIHGHGELFDKILSWLNGRTKPWKCVFLGDACDRRDDGYRIIETLLNDDRFIYLKGNHEDLFVRAAKALRKHWGEEGFFYEEVAANPYEFIMNFAWDWDVSLHIQNGGLQTLLDWATKGRTGLKIIGELRKAGINSSIIIMNPELTAFKTMFDYKLEPEVYSFNLLNELIKSAEKEGVTNFPIHIKLDTGMHRLGFAPEDIPELIARLKRQTSVIPRSVFSHLVGSDSAQFDAFTRQQIETFEKASEELQAAFPHKILRHICNTAGIERYPGAQFDMVRLGLGLYGVNPFTNQMIKNVSTLKTTILQIREVPQEDSVGYSRKGRLNRDSRIAAIPIGYADGLNRRLGNGNAYCLVNGKKAPYVGNICMDVCMIDVTDIDCKEGDKVIYPLTSTKAIVDESGNRVTLATTDDIQAAIRESIINELNSDV